MSGSERPANQRGPAQIWQVSTSGAGALQPLTRDLNSYLQLGVTSDGSTVAAGVGVAMVVCGDWSLDRGSGSVPAFLAARLGAAQALGLARLHPDASGLVHAERRLDLGRREVLRVRAPAVLSVEGATARLRRAPLPALLRARGAAVDHLPAADPAATGVPEPTGPPRRGPYRPRPRVLPGPDPGASARERILALTGALAERTPPQTVRLDPGPAADRILDQLRTWGYLE